MPVSKRLLLVTALVLGLSTSGSSWGIAGHEPTERFLGPPGNSSPAPLPLPGAKKLTELQKAYLDAYSILSRDNSCSRFFGGSPVIDALNGLTRGLGTTHMDRTIILVMKGEITEFATSTGFSYRLFHRAEINMNGAFYQGAVVPGRATIPPVGRFAPNTREARVTVLLHELGHLVRGPDDRWLLPDDGGQPEVSIENTDRVIAVCGEQIRRLRKITFVEELAALQTQPSSQSIARKD